MTIYGYACVSPDGPSLAAEQAALREAGAAKLFSDTKNGAGAGKPQLRRVINSLCRGDLLLVMHLDRLAHSSRDLLNLLDHVVKVGAGFKSLADKWADTTTTHGGLLATTVSGFAEFEHRLTKARTIEGIKRAKAGGVHIGRPRRLTADQREEALRRREAGETLREIAATYGCSYMTISRLR